MLLNLLLVFCLLAWQPSLAAEKKNLFEAEAITLSQEPEDRQAAAREALMIVLQRIVAGVNLTTDPSIHNVLNRAQALIKREWFTEAENPYTPDTLARVMHIEFDAPALVDMLNQGKLPLWKGSRPETLVWLVVDDLGVRHLFNAETMPELNKFLQESEQQQGLHLKMPTPNRKGQQALTVEQVLSSNPEALLKASAPYHSPSILAGQLVNKKWCWESSWTLHFKQNAWQWTGACGSMSEALSAGIQGSYDKLAGVCTAAENQCGVVGSKAKPKSTAKSKPKPVQHCAKSGKASATDKNCKVEAIPELPRSARRNPRLLAKHPETPKPEPVHGSDRAAHPSHPIEHGKTTPPLPPLPQKPLVKQPLKELEPPKIAPNQEHGLQGDHASHGEPTKLDKALETVKAPHQDKQEKEAPGDIPKSLKVTESIKTPPPTETVEKK